MAPRSGRFTSKVKPGDNNSCHYCSLLMPDGLQGNRVYPELKRVETELDRNWKHTQDEMVPMTALENGAAAGSSTEKEADRDEAPAFRDIGRLTPIDIGPISKGSNAGADQMANGSPFPLRPGQDERQRPRLDRRSRQDALDPGGDSGNSHRRLREQPGTLRPNALRNAAGKASTGIRWAAVFTSLVRKA